MSQDLADTLSPDLSDTLRAEAATWLIADPDRRREKLRRERIRHHRLIRDLLLHKLDVHNMDVLEVGGGPQPISDLLTFKTRVVVDPLSDEYRRIAPCPDHIALRGEDMEFEGHFDLAISTNSLDHVEDPERVFDRMSQALRAGGYMAIQCPENNAITNPHPAHIHNLTATLVHQWADADFETVWELNWLDHGYRYGWPVWDGRRGQPAFCLLLRKCSGYDPPPTAQHP